MKVLYRDGESPLNSESKWQYDYIYVPVRVFLMVFGGVLIFLPFSIDSKSSVTQNHIFQNSVVLKSLHLVCLGVALPFIIDILADLVLSLETKRKSKLLYNKNLLTTIYINLIYY